MIQYWRSIGLAIAAIAVLIALLLPALQPARESGPHRPPHHPNTTDGTATDRSGFVITNSGMRLSSEEFQNVSEEIARSPEVECKHIFQISQDPNNREYDDRREMSVYVHDNSVPQNWQRVLMDSRDRGPWRILGVRTIRPENYKSDIPAGPYRWAE